MPPSGPPVPPDAPAPPGPGAVTVLFFAGARQAAGQSRASMPAGATVAELAERLHSSYGEQMAAVLASCAIWVNGLPAEPGMLLHAGDEVALLPPVSGG
ncbi:MAG: MoaD/ThiS family protein [Acidimicrobiales bacterium]